MSERTDVEFDFLTVDIHVLTNNIQLRHGDVLKWTYFLHYWPFVRGIHRSPVNPAHKGQWRGALMFSLIHAWINGWVNNDEAGNLGLHRAHNDVTVMEQIYIEPGVSLQ